jgi:anti-sigma factor RsiW
MNCELAKNLIQPYLEGRLPVLERNEFVHHVTECGACEREVIAYRELFRGLRDVPRLEAPERLAVAVIAQLRADGLVHEPRFSGLRRAVEGFFALPARARYPLSALAVVLLLYVPVALILGRAGRSVAGIAESFARAVVWLQGAVAGLPGVAAFDPYVRAARTVARAAGEVVSPGLFLVASAAIILALYTMLRVLRRKRPSDHAIFSF